MSTIATRILNFFCRCFDFFHNKLDLFNSVRVKLALLILVFCHVIIMFWWSLYTFRSKDSIPSVDIVGIATRKKIEGLTTNVKCGLYIKNFPTFEFSTNSFVMDATVWFEFNKNQIMLKTIDNFSFENGKMISKTDPIVTINGDDILVRFDVIVDLKTSLDFHLFPLEDHTLSISIINNTVTIDEMYFEDDFDAIGLKVSDKLFTSHWKLFRTRGYAGSATISLSKTASWEDQKTKRSIQIPKVVFVLDFRKVGFNKLLIIFIPIFAAIFFSFITFLMSFNSYQGKTNIALTAATALLGYRFVIQQMSPSVGYFTITDTLFIFFLILAVAVLVFQITLLRHYMLLMEREKINKSETTAVDRSYLTPKRTEQLNTLVYLVCLTVFVTVVTYTLW